MAKQDKETYESYAKDMFDNPPAGPMGVHRGARSMASRALPYVIVVIVALLAGLLFWGVYSGEISNLRMPWSAKEDGRHVQRRQDGEQEVRGRQEDQYFGWPVEGRFGRQPERGTE